MEQLTETCNSVQVAVAVVYCLLSAGVVFGYAAIKPVFIKEGVYSQHCSSEAISSVSKTCYEQEIRLVLNPMTVFEMLTDENIPG